MPSGMLELKEDDRFFFDPDAGERPIRFIEKYCRHYEGALTGEPFLLETIQKQVIRDLYGWKWRATLLRRFTDCYWEAAVGSGKSPLLAALGLYGLCFDNEPGAQVYSLANSFGQARVVFDCAGEMVNANRELQKRIDVQQFTIRHRKSRSFWRIVSGDGPGAGCRPTTILGDEVHEWKHAKAYRALRDRMFKRRQPLFIGATNAGETQACFCWKLREAAVAALNGDGPPSLYPIIWAADETADSNDPAAWKEANPLMGITIKQDKIAQICAQSVKDEDEHRNFRRLYLGIWPATAEGSWLNLAEWDECSKAPFDVPADAPLYIGLDLSQGDDLCAATWVYVTPERFYLDWHFWLPEATAEHYQETEEIPYLEWAKADPGRITLVKSRTINPKVRKEIAAKVIEKGKGREVKAVCFDRYKADETIAALEAVGMICVPIAQGYSVSPGCNELESRIKEQSVVIAANALARFCAENAQVKEDDRGNIWPCKPNARGKYAGKRGKKIDAISSAVTALTEARKHTFPNARKFFRGQIATVKGGG